MKSPEVQVLRITPENLQSRINPYLNFYIADVPVAKISRCRLSFAAQTSNLADL